MFSKIKLKYFVVVVLTSFLFIISSSSSNADALCGSGSTCVGITKVDIANGCNPIPNTDYCTQDWYIQQLVGCDIYEGTCTYSRPGVVCTDTIKPCNYTYDADYHEGGCCKTDPCIPSTSCSCNSPLSSTNQGNDSISVSCSNGCGGTASSTCYCPPADCADLDDQTTWYNTKQAEGDRESNIPVPVVPTPPDGCPETQVKTCYNTDNEKPTVVSVEVIPPEDKILGFSSESYSGRGLEVENGGGVNNPVGLTATYTDTDGQDDIQAIYIWWNPSDTKTFPTPDKLGTGEIQTDSNENFGFMISRDTIGGTWDKVYVPGEGNVFVQAGTVGNPVNIEGPGSEYMVELNNISVTDSGTNEIQLELTMRFLTDTGDTVSTDQYNIWAMANDYIGFTQFETDNKIKDYNEWEDSGENWNLDMVNPPTLSINSISDTHVGEITVAINTEDNDNISYVRLDACKSGIAEEIFNLDSNYIIDPDDSYTLKDCGNFGSTNINMTSGDSLLGTDGHFPGNSYSPQDIIIDLNNNAEGSITFYLTVMDDAGNFDQVFDIYRLEQWAMVNNGFVYGKGGVTSSSRLVQAGSWDNDHPILGLFDASKADITNQVLMGGTPSLTSRLRELERYKENKSFKVAKYPGILMTTPYSELISAYKQKADNSNSSFEHHIIGDIPINRKLSSYCIEGEDFCILEKDGDLNIAKNFNCDGKGLIIAKGDITITPDLTSGDSIDEACIILSGGNINIKPGKDLGITSNPVPAPEYDEVHGYLIANGEIVIEKHSTPIDIDSSSNQPGLYVKGGLSAFTPNLSGPAAVYNEREIYFGHMGIYPVLVVDSNAKYGFLSTGVFGSQIDIFKLEIGFKPY